MPGYYDYDELAERALSADATQSDIDALGKWFECYGSSYWNGEYYEISDSRRLFPIYVEDEDEQYTITGYEIR